MWDLDHKVWAPKNQWFKIVVLEKILESPLDSKAIKPVNLKGNQSWLSFEGLMLKLKLQSFCHLMQRANSLEKTLRPGKIEGRKRREWQSMRWLDGISDSMDMSCANSRRWWRTRKPGIVQSMGLQRVGHSLATEQQTTTGSSFYKNKQRLILKGF